MLGLALDMTPEELKMGGKAEVFDEYRRRRGDVNPPKEIPASESPVKEIILQGKDIDLSLLPITHHTEHNPGKYISAGMTICKDPDTGIPNVGVYRIHVKGKDRFGCAMRPSNNGGLIARRYAELGKTMEVVTFIGHHPAVFNAATTIGPLEMNELEVMGSLLGEPLEVTATTTVDLPVPARAEIAIEGIIDPSKMDTDGPFSEAFGYYGDERPCYVTQVTAITMRQDAIYHDLYPAHIEHNLSYQLSRESNLYDRVKSAVPTIKAVHYGPEKQMASNLVYISIRKRSQGEGRLAGLTALNSDIISKIAVVVDDDIDVYNEHEVLWAIGTRVRADSDILIIPRMPTIHLNPCAYNETETWTGYMDAKILIDATKPADLPFAVRVTPPKSLWDYMKLEDYLG
ncbi:UbiD family decarboxylase, partial [Chloroflexota bacterium]